MSAPEFSFPVRVYYEDTDASGVAYHASYLRWFERARTEWLRARGHGQEPLRGEGVAFTVANLSIAYLRPARLDDACEVVTRIAQTRRASLGFAQELRRDGVVLARAEVRVGCVGMADFRPRPLPEGMFEPPAS